ncbi:UDP-glucosyltransferase 2-like isoform X6 [Adelges cooleyi]|uniref:UDP-glucosyltransferase 2-like isoform X6 n=1 Tax=Adelges cooleyi TaxID=133065 RepID=UPI0021803847|nr:UDP-glucosyltransferase 2-like isoform X6 [Adelges cooleyi]
MRYSTALLCALAALSAQTGPRPVESFRILALESVAGKSHWNFVRAVLRALTDRGHEVTVFTPFPDGDRANYTEVDLSNTVPIKLSMDFDFLVSNYGDPIKLIPQMVFIGKMLCDSIYIHDRMKHIMDTAGQGMHFDAVLAEPLGTDCVNALASKLGLPIIYLVPSPTLTYMERSFTGHVSNPAYVAHLFSYYGSPSKSFVQRFLNTVLYVYAAAQMQFDEIVHRARFPNPYDHLKPINPSIIFQNTHHVTEPPRPFPSNLVQIGGIHLSATKGIPTDILEFIENSPHGVIYFTFGSVVSMSTLPDHIQKAFKEALAQVPQRVLWKYEGEMKDKPANVMTSKWFPQRDILLHPNVKLFISHGGISGVYEAVDAGVPVLGFPLFYDQPRNIENLVEAGMAISLDLLKVTKKPFLDAVTELINNKSYAENAKITSERFKDRPMTPAESVVYWTEYVIRHKGAPHLRSHALDLTWYQYFLLDVIAALLLALSIAGYVAYKVLKLIYSLASGQLLKNTKHKAE